MVIINLCACAVRSHYWIAGARELITCCRVSDGHWLIWPFCDTRNVVILTKSNKSYSKKTSFSHTWQNTRPSHANSLVYSFLRKKWSNEKARFLHTRRETRLTAFAKWCKVSKKCITKEFINFLITNYPVCRSVVHTLSECTVVLGRYAHRRWENSSRRVNML